MDCNTIEFEEKDGTINYLAHYKYLGTNETESGLQEALEHIVTNQDGHFKDNNPKANLLTFNKTIGTEQNYEIHYNLGLRGIKVRDQNLVYLEINHDDDEAHSTYTETGPHEFINTKSDYLHFLHSADTSNLVHIHRPYKLIDNKIVGASIKAETFRDIKIDHKVKTKLLGIPVSYQNETKEWIKFES